jgi:hypothetical protein
MMLFFSKRYHSAGVDLTTHKLLTPQAQPTPLDHVSPEASL